VEANAVPESRADLIGLTGFGELKRPLIAAWKLKNIAASTVELSHKPILNTSPADIVIRQHMGKTAPCCGAVSLYGGKKGRFRKCFVTN
jgi:hypothetical protein